MGRHKGSRNFVEFQKRTVVETSPSNEVRHLANIKGNPLQEFHALLTHQGNFLRWVDARHELVVGLKEKINKLEKRNQGKGPQGAKEGTFVKYRWYAEQLVLLEAINAFETFFKKTFVGLGETLRDYIQPEEFRDVRIDAMLIWSTAGQISAPALMFEQSLFHDLDAVDKCSKMLVGDRRYNQNSPKPVLAARVKALRGIFQVRHTLSHNNGLVTEGDAAKFKRFGFNIVQGEVIDPAKNYLGLAVFRELGCEAHDFTAWLAVSTARFLQDCIKNAGASISGAKRQELESLLGVHPCWATVTWS